MLKLHFNFLEQNLIIRTFFFFLIIFLFTSCSIITKFSTSSYSVIINSKSRINNVEKSELRKLYLRKNKYLNRKKIIPVNLLADNSARIAFESNILNMDRASLNAYWIKQHKKGINPPVSQESYNAMLNFVINVNGAIGYIPSNMVDNRVKVIHEF